MDTGRWLGTGRRVGAGSPAKGPALLANLHQAFTVDAATVFAGKPAPTPDRGWTSIGGWAQAPSCRSGFTREEAGPAGQSPPAVHPPAVHRCLREQARSGHHNQ
ncbi:hypothetical protein GEV41_19695 [Pseudomonas putida]|nr:hypothetical protein GEV41_19695 [Pseudomonas putida]